MEFKARLDWVEGRSIVRGRSSGGQITLKKFGDAPGQDTFLVRIGKDGARQVTGHPKNAKEALRELRVELKHEAYEPTRTLRLGTFLESGFLPWKRLSVKPKTYGGYQAVIEDRIIPALGHLRLQSLSRDHLQQWVDEMWEEGLRPKSVREYFGVLRGALNRAVSDGYFRTSPAVGVELRPRTGDWWLMDPAGSDVDDDEGADISRVWTEEECARFCRLAHWSDEMTRWVRLALVTGLRPQEQCAIRWRDIDLKGGLLHVRAAVIEVDRDRRKELGKWQYGIPKTGRRTITLCPDGVSVLRAQQAAVQSKVGQGKLTDERANFVFPCRSGPRAFNNPCNMKNRLRVLIVGSKDRASKGGIPGLRYIPPYGMRHTHATRLLANKWTAFQVAKRLGTGRDMIYRHYGHLLPDEESQALRSVPPLREFTRDAAEDVSRAA